MSKLFPILLVAVFATMFFVACEKTDNAAAANDEVSPAAISLIKKLGFTTAEVQKVDGGYLVEGDIFLSESDLNRTFAYQFFKIAEVEQYRTTQLVTGLPRSITVSLDNRLTGIAGYIQALDEVVRRYNALGLQITFSRVASGGNIVFSRASGSYLASAGFPTATGAPFNSVKVNSSAIGSGTSSTFINYCASIMAHEAGHCIGMRHTDYADRSYSCGGSPSNEGASTVGAVLIPGTPSGPDPNSWMLACTPGNTNRPFNANDITALNFLY
jgi:hypothetical protein